MAGDHREQPDQRIDLIWAREFPQHPQTWHVIVDNDLDADRYAAALCGYEPAEWGWQVRQAEGYRRDGPQCPHCTSHWAATGRPL